MQRRGSEGGWNAEFGMMNGEREMDVEWDLGWWRRMMFVEMVNVRGKMKLRKEHAI